MTQLTVSGSKNCRLLYLVGQLGRGGLERQLTYLLQAMDRERYNPVVVVWNHSPDDFYVKEIKTLGVPIHSLPSGVSRVAKLQAFCCLTGRLKPEVIHSYTFFTNFAAYWAGLRTRAVAVGSLRGDLAHAKKDSGPWIGCLSARWPRDQISNNFASAKKARASYGISSHKRISVIWNGVDLQRFCCFNSNAASKRSIVGIGSLLPLKRWDRVLRIVRLVRNKNAACKVVIVGEGPERGSLERLARDLGVAQAVEFIGATSDVPAILRESRFLVHTSDIEGCPNAVLEAMACGRGVVAMEAGDISTLIEDGKTGFVVRQGDEEAFAQRVLQLLADDELCLRMGRAARAKAERQFGLDRFVSETLSAYRSAGWKDSGIQHLCQHRRRDL